MRPDITTRRGIDEQIMQLRRMLKLHEDDYDQVQEIGYEIEKLRNMKESMHHPWEKPRPLAESSLMSFGVGL